MSRESARTFAEKGVPGGARLSKMLEDRNRTLTSILIGNTFVLLATDSIATYLFILLGVPQAPLWSTSATTVVLACCSARFSRRRWRSRNSGTRGAAPVAAADDRHLAA